MAEIVSNLTAILSERCLCELSRSLFGLMQFRCSKDDKVVIVQGRLIGLPTITSSELMVDLQEWVNSGPSIVVDGKQFNIQEQCTVIINNLNTTDCVQTASIRTTTAIPVATSTLVAANIPVATQTPTVDIFSLPIISVVGGVVSVLAFLLIAFTVGIVLCLTFKRTCKTASK